MPLDGTICGIDQRNLRRIESAGVTEDTLPGCKKLGIRHLIRVKDKKRSDKA